MIRKIFVILLLFIASCGSKHFTTENQVDCVLAYTPWSSSISCNWDKYNNDTKYGEYPYSVE